MIRHQRREFAGENDHNQELFVVLTVLFSNITYPEYLNSPLLFLPDYLLCQGTVEWI